MSTPASDRFLLIGNLLCLDFVDTEILRQGEPVDLLADFGELTGWLEATGTLGREAARRARREWEGTREAEETLAAARVLRTQLRRTAERLSAGSGPAAEALAAINRVLAGRAAFPQLVREDGRIVTRVTVPEPAPRHLLVPVAESAAWLLEHGDPALVRRCENPECILYFYDTTKNHRRRWCRMEACGSRAKARAYYHRRTRGRGR